MRIEVGASRPDRYAGAREKVTDATFTLVAREGPDDPSLLPAHRFRQAGFGDQSRQAVEPVDHLGERHQQE